MSSGKGIEFWQSDKTWVEILTLPLTSFVTLGKLCELPKSVIQLLLLALGARILQLTRCTRWWVPS